MKAPTEPGTTGALLVLLALALATPSLAQTSFWVEDFNNGCVRLCPGDGYTGANGAWTVTDVNAPGASANIWYVSCAENGGAAGTCSSGCGGDATLHVGNVSTSPAAFLFCPDGDCGAAYDATDASVVADKRIASPLIDASGKTGLSVSFIYLGAGQRCADSADLVLSTDGGLTWTVLAACITTNNASCGGQGLWTDKSVNLPSSADNNPALRIGFHWRNNGDGRGSDPSFAVDNVSVLSSSCSGGPAPQAVGNSLRGNRTASDASFDWSLMGATAPPTTHFHVYRAATKGAPLPAGWVLIAGDTPRLVTQKHADPVIGDASSYFYDVRAADDCEKIGP